MTKSKLTLLFTVLFGVLLAPAFALEIENHTDYDIVCTWSDDDDIPGLRVTVDDKPCISYRLWKELVKKFPKSLAKTLCADVPLLEDDIDSLVFTDATHVEGACPEDVCVYVTKGPWTNQWHLCCDEKYGGGEIYVGHDLDKL